MNDDAEDDESRARYAKGLPGYHDYLARVTGAPSGLSALTLRLWLAGFGMLFCLVAGALLIGYLPPLAWFGWLLIALGVIAVIDFAWVAHRKRRGEPG
ncbi:MULTISPECIES: hypothetical protein [Actinopolyspora]|uniref:Uncharacterized protein n=1 Tax=Actinopolyspora saharensis TaxID=995062 RepID=A0A1H0ZIX0_9ACTN|nr:MULTISPECIES: hypothetical protein [Actinopolyspora]NHD15763.1 hypothetical protein [Actinopolyspora sp. BKK2]NHE75023.1 hypothetical protein [Actinopolyspora sp. BKK1]SDQ27393.1 hypothetical protein SAMN04489718_1074 [Actinopolyspora saharensis]